MKKPTRAQIATAYHEAGHAVAAHLVGIRVLSAGIEPAEGFLGLVAHEGVGAELLAVAQGSAPLTLALRARLEAHVLMLLAGSIAEHRQRGRRDHIGSSQDHARALDWLERVSGTPAEAEAYAAWLGHRAEGLLTLGWAEVERLAAALLEQGSLAGETVHALVALPFGALAEAP